MIDINLYINYLIIATLSSLYIESRRGVASTQVVIPGEEVAATEVRNGNICISIS
jgi:hypothetical protein